MFPVPTNLFARGVHPAFLVFAVVLLFCVGFAAVINSEAPVRVKPVFKDGEMVTMKVDGSRVMVLYARWCIEPSCEYVIRRPGTLEQVSVREIEITR